MANLIGVTGMIMAGAAPAPAGPTAEIFELLDIPVTAPSVTNQYAIGVPMTLTSPSARTIIVPAAWDDGDNYFYRVSGDEVGTWTYSTPAGSTELHGLSGSFQVTPNSAAYGRVSGTAGGWWLVANPAWRRNARADALQPDDGKCP